MHEQEPTSPDVQQPPARPLSHIGKNRSIEKGLLPRKAVYLVLDRIERKHTAQHGVVVTQHTRNSASAQDPEDLDAKRQVSDRIAQKPYAVDPMIFERAQASLEADGIAMRIRHEAKLGGFHA